MRQKPLSLRLELLRPSKSGELFQGSTLHIWQVPACACREAHLVCHFCRHLQELVRPGHWPKRYDVRQMLWVSR